MYYTYDCAEPLSTYPSARELAQIQVQEWVALGLHLGLTDDEVKSIDKDLDPTVAILLAAKFKRTEIAWKDVVEGLLKIGEYKQAEMICSKQGWLIP